MTKYDDGSQQWLDEMVMTKIRQGKQQPQYTNGTRGYNPQAYNPALDRVVTTQQRQLTAEEAEDIRKARERAEKTYMRAPHYAPVHLVQKGLAKADDWNEASRARASDYQIKGDYGQQVERLGEYINHKFGPGDNSDQILAAMPANQRNILLEKLHALQTGQPLGPNPLLAGYGPQPNMMKQPQMQPPQMANPQICKLYEGHPLFQPIQANGFGSTVPLLRFAGQTSQKIMGLDFVIRGVVKGYALPPNQTVVDLKILQNNPNLLQEYVQLDSPPISGLGTVLVAKEAIFIPGNNMGQNPSYGQRQMLTDARVRPQQAMPQQQPPRFNPNIMFSKTGNGKGILKG